MKLTIKRLIEREICHFADAEVCITSTYNKIYVQKGGSESVISLPADALWKRVFCVSRLARRALRLDKCNVVPVPGGLVIVRQAKVYHYDDGTKKLTHTLTLKNCRNILHQSIGITPKSPLLRRIWAQRAADRCAGLPQPGWGEKLGNRLLGFCGKNQAHSRLLLRSLREKDLGLYRGF